MVTYIMDHPVHKRLLKVRYILVKVMSMQDSFEEFPKKKS